MSNLKERRQEVVELCKQGKLEQAQNAAQEYSFGFFLSFKHEEGEIMANMAETIRKYRGLIGDLI